MRVLLVDDNPEFLKAAERILSRTPHLEVVGRASSGEEAVDQTRALRPELVLINWSLPGINGLEATRRINAQPDPPRVLILSLQDYPEYRLASKEAGAEGFISKAEFGEKIPSLIDYLIAQEDFQKPISPGQPRGEDLIAPLDQPQAVNVPSGETTPARPAEESSEPPKMEPGPPFFEASQSASESSDRSSAAQRMPELLETLREGLTALETHYLYLQRWLQSGEKDSAPGQRDPVQKVRRFSGPFGGAVAYYLLFEINKETYGLPADRVLSVEKPAPLIRLPREYEPLVGLSDIDDLRVPIVDLRLWEGMKKTPPGEAGRLILVETRKSAAGLLVDTVCALTTSAGSNGFPLPPHPEATRRPYLDRIVQIKDRFIFVWDVDKIVDFLI